MAQSKLLLDTNVVIDYLNEREPYYEKARLLMIGGRVGEFELWISSSQVTDLVYILSNERARWMPSWGNCGACASSSTCLQRARGKST